MCIRDRDNSSDETGEGITTMAKGGPIIGKPHSQGGKDINVEGGEFVMSKKTVQKYGVNVLNAINQGILHPGVIIVDIKNF